MDHPIPLCPGTTATPHAVSPEEAAAVPVSPNDRSLENHQASAKAWLTARELVEEPSPDIPSIRTFASGANRDQDTSKFDYEGFLSPQVIERFGAYMHKNRTLRDGTLRASDNWQRGIPLEAYMKSLMRHVFTLWRHHRGVADIISDEGIEEALCGVMFNAQGYLHETLKKPRLNSSGLLEEGLPR